MSMDDCIFYVIIFYEFLNQYYYCANLCGNLTFHRFARVTQKTEHDRTDKKSYTQCIAGNM